MIVDDKLYTKLCEINAIISCVGGVAKLSYDKNYLLESKDSKSFFPKGIVDTIIVKELCKCQDIVNEIINEYEKETLDI